MNKIRVNFYNLKLKNDILANIYKSINKNIIFLPFAFLLLHQFSDFLIYKVIFFFSIFILIKKLDISELKKKKIINSYELLILVFFFLLFQSAFVSIVHNPLDEIFVSLLKFLSLPCIIFIYYLHIINKNEILFKLYDIYFIFSVFAVLTVIIQFFIGPMELFGNPEMRQASQRFNSLAGNNLVFASFFIIPLLYVFFLKKYNPVLKFFILCLFVFAAIFSVSKAFLINLFFFIFLFICLHGINFFKKNIKLVIYFILSIFIILAFIFFTDNFVKDYIYSILKVFTNSRSNILINLKIRLVDSVFYYADKDILTYLFGYGVAGGGGVFGLISINNNDLNSAVYTTHNQFFDLIGIGGLLLMIVFIVLLFYSIKFALSYTGKERSFLISILAYSFMNCLVFNGYIFQPYLGAFMWLTFIHIIVIKRKSL